MPNWATSITYHPNGLVNQITHANGVVSTQANDPNRMKRPASITVTKSTSTLFATGAYAYDGSGNVSKIGSDYYLYDTLGRLKEGTALQAGSSNRQTYGYDGFGNLTSTTSWVNGSGTTRTNAVVGTTNRLSAAGYDAAGNQTTWGTYSYTWDLMGMMKAYQGSGNDWAYAYDADDERMFVYNVVTGQSTFRIRGLDGKVLREVKLTGSTWSWGKDWIYRDGQLLATTASGSVTRYAHADHLGSPRLFTDTAGVAKDKFHYYPFGEQAGTAPTAPEALRFTGHERDSGASTGTADDLDYMHARYYHPQLGRFLSFDPGDSARGVKPVTWNKYAYATNNPLRYVDPDGEDVWAKLGDHLAGVGDALRNNATLGGFSRGDGNADFRRGQLIGDAISYVGGIVEAGTGGFISLGGMACAVGTAGGCAPATTVAVVAGGTMVAHGQQVWAHAAQNLSNGTSQMSSQQGRSGGLSINQMDRQVKRGQAPKGITRVDGGRSKHEQPHVHFEDGAALNKNGTWKHGQTTLTRAQEEWLTNNGWKIPGNESVTR